MTTPHSAAPERSVVDRTLSILGAFDRDNRTLTLSDISRRSGLPVATVHRIVNKLHGWGALERCADGGYSIGLRLWETAVLAPRSSAVVEAAQPHLVTLHGQTSAAATIAIRDGKESVCLSFVSGEPEVAATYGDPGRRVPLHATAVGLVLLAHAGAALQNEVCTAPLRAYTSATITDGAQLKQCLAKVRREGYAVVHGTLSPARGGFAIPVRDSRGMVVAAVGVVGPSEVVQPRRVAPHVRAAAAMIQRCVRSEGLRVTEVGA
ncbi:IclR family transcriptional regulator [Streptomyces sp. NBC_01275]|uniref:IclR family transcriptional regulator n=1 Tax=Streptomyces sp. NBC_01275 TaxID=2903807 RepID=UPI0022549334|nr:IclR family transcriptional regulator [Streptomyces sp. NBC_01275]MCX4759588.1 IclR family transcriptional regulator [Streptomyces sp. NBC_01275]